MLNQIGNYKKVPNSYVYTSHRGSEYIFLEGVWYNCSNMNAIDSSKNHKMNQSALQQISEQNKSSTLKIGQQYLINESEYVYVGRGKVTKDGFLLHESTNNTIVNLMERDNEESKQETKVPDGYVYTSNKDKKYFKKGGQWFSSETKKPINSSNTAPLERAAQASIERHNQSAPVKIGDEWTSKKGITYKYVGGNRFISDSGKLLPPEMAKQVLNNLYSKSSPEQEQSSDTPSEQPKNQDGSAQQEQPRQEQPNQGQPNTEQGSNDQLQGLADKIKSNPEARRIIVLLSRGDAVSLLAADILLSGQEKEAAQILNSLNNKD